LHKLKEDVPVSGSDIIADQESFRALVARLAVEQVIAVDLEADSLHHYTEKVCLIQVSTQHETSLIDPLAPLDLTLLAPVMANPAILKIFHGADYDMRSLYRDFGIEVRNLFDTMIAAQFLGEKELGLAAQLKKRFGVELDKRFQKADWSKRPLSPEMMEYARKDTSLLIELYGQMVEELRVKGRLAWVEEESELVAGVRSAVRDGEPLYLRFKGATKLKPRTLAILEELLRFRDEKARQIDVPPFKILGNEIVRELAEKRPRTMAELTAIQGLSPKLIDRYGRGLLQSVAAGVALPADRLPHFPAVQRTVRSRYQEECLKRLKVWREEKAEYLGIGIGLVANNTLLEALADAPPEITGGKDPFSVLKLKEWQKEALGNDLLEILREGE
jgi:ribonuclease D